MVSKFKSLMQVQSFSNVQAMALVFMRLIFGIAFILHGWGKIQNPFGWMPAEAGIPAVFQFLAALSEFGGGIALILGLLTRLAAVGMAFAMLGATLLHAVVKGDPFVNLTGGGSYEPALGYLGLSILFIFFGPGKYSLDKMIFGSK